MLRTAGTLLLVLAAVSATGFAQSYGQNDRDLQDRDLQGVRSQVQSIDRHAARLGRTDEPYVVLSDQFNIPVATLRDQREDMNLTFGQLSAAHAIARSSGRDFASVARQFQNGDTWSDIVRDSGANMHDVNRQLRMIDNDLRIRPTRPYQR